MSDRNQGGCACKAIRFSLSGPMQKQIHCHCESCRRTTSSPFTSWFTVMKSEVTFSGIEPTTYASSPGVTRKFCPRCGTPLTYESTKFPGEIDLYAASLDDHSHFAPQQHVYWSERVLWIDLADDLPRKR